MTFERQIFTVDWDIGSSVASEGSYPRVDSLLDTGVNALECKTDAGGWEPALSTVFKAAFHASVLDWALTVVRGGSD